MNNFDFYNPTKLLFGRGKIAQLAKEIPADARVLVTYGGGSIKANGVYDQVTAALKDHVWMEFGGIEANPRYETLMQAVELVNREAVTFLLAVGGGSVGDGTKFIAAAAQFDGEPWDILARSATIRSALPLGVVLTLPATGTESNGNAVISRNSTNEKLAFGSALCYPKFAVLDPETTYSLAPRQIANGIVDAFTHTMEQYMTYPSDAPLQDRLAESILQTLIEVGPQALARPHDYQVRANVMWCATLALNGLIGCGVPQDWSTHMIGHELTALHGLDHAQTLAIVLPGVWRKLVQDKREKLLQYADRVWGIREGSEAERIEQAIVRTESFFESLGVPTRLSGYGVSAVAQTAGEVERRFASRGLLHQGERGHVTPSLAREIVLDRA